MFSALAMFAGTWTSSGTFTQPGASAPTAVRGTITCSWSNPDRVFLVCDGRAQIGSDPKVARQVSIYTYDAVRKSYGFANITPDSLNSPDLTLNGNTWTYSSKSTDSGKTRYYRTLNTFQTTDRYTYTVQYSDDGTHWITTGSGVSTRSPQASFDSH